MKLARACVLFLALATCWIIAAPHLAAIDVAADPPAAVTYTISLANPEQHLAHVQIVVPAGHPAHELQLPVWNALYQIRDFSQYVNWIRARDRAGKPLVIRELDKSRWQIEGTADGAVIEYEIYLDSPGPFGAQINAHHAFLNLAEVLMYPVDARSSRLTLHFSHVPSAWHIATPLKSVR